MLLAGPTTEFLKRRVPFCSWKTSTHAGVGNRLGFHYREEIDTRIFSRLRKEREGCDYELSEPSEERAQACIQQARSFVEAAEILLESA